MSRLFNHRLRLILVLALLSLALQGCTFDFLCPLFFLPIGNPDVCDEPTRTCLFLGITVARDSCTPFDNPCFYPRWGRLDGFDFTSDKPPGISLKEGETGQRSMCAQPSAPLLTFHPFTYFYANSDTREPGEGEGTVTIVPPLAVTASATKTTLNPGDTVQLQAFASGGLLPYSYAWTPNAGLSNATIANPMATVFQTVTYTVTVTDAVGKMASDSIQLSVGPSVGLSVNVTANPLVIKPGEMTDLFAEVSGGTLPYTFAWTPVAPLDNPKSAGPIATPLVTTTFQVTVTDATGQKTTGSVTVLVLTPPASGADLDVAMSAAAPNPDTLTYTILVTDNGPDAATDIALKSVLQPNVALASIPPGCAGGAGGTITCGPLSLGAGDEAIFTFGVRPLSAFPTITNTVTVMSPTVQDPNPANNLQSVTTLGSNPSTTADLRITLSSSPEPVPLNTPLILTATVTNGGPSDATNVVVTYTPPNTDIDLTSAMPSQGSCSPPDGNTPITCSLGSLARGLRATITIVGIPRLQGTLTSTATVTADQVDPGQTNNPAMTNTTVP
jgi:uncharacterized repeat protein (TIGR01451 family)